MIPESGHLGSSSAPRSTRNAFRPSDAPVEDWRNLAAELSSRCPDLWELVRGADGTGGGRDVHIAVSGGPDSTALLILATFVAEDPGVVVAHHVDHGIREGSGAEAAIVFESASAFGARFESHKVDVPPGPNLEARLREARLSVLPKGVATGHTADDQAETVILNLMRGSGTDGLSGMKRSTAKPLLPLRRHEARSLCRAVGISTIEDPSNSDLGYRRNQVRHRVLPLLSEVAERDLVPVLARQCEYMAAEAGYLNDASLSIDACSARQVREAPPALARRAVRAWLASALGRPASSAEVERVMAVARNEATGCELEGGYSVRRSGGHMRIITPAQSGRAGSTASAHPGKRGEA